MFRKPVTGMWTHLCEKVNISEMGPKVPQSKMTRITKMNPHCALELKHIVSVSCGDIVVLALQASLFTLYYIIVFIPFMGPFSLLRLTAA